MGEQHERSPKLKKIDTRVSIATSIAHETILRFSIGAASTGQMATPDGLNIAMAILAAKIFEAIPDSEV